MTSRLNSCFDRLKDNGDCAFIPYIMGGDPALVNTVDMMHVLADNGADIIEVGFPFSDPTADGPSIQAAGERAIGAGSSLRTVLAHCTEFRKTNNTTPIIIMGYANPIMNYGYEACAEAMNNSGVDGCIIVDLPPEEETELTQYLQPYKIEMIRLLAPTTVGERLSKLLQHSSGFVYNIAIKGITGTGSAHQDSLTARIKDIRAHTALPIVTGFGIKTASQAKELRNHSDGVVVGSALVDQLYNAHHNNKDVRKVAASFVKDIVQVLHG